MWIVGRFCFKKGVANKKSTQTFVEQTVSHWREMSVKSGSISRQSWFQAVHAFSSLVSLVARSWGKYSSELCNAVRCFVAAADSGRRVLGELTRTGRSSSRMFPGSPVYVAWARTGVTLAAWGGRRCSLVINMVLLCLQRPFCIPGRGFVYKAELWVRSSVCPQRGWYRLPRKKEAIQICLM